MDTNWNNTAEARRKGPGLRAVIAALALFLGLSLTLGSLSTAAGHFSAGTDPDGWWQEDFQQTPAFREAVADYLERFLTLGAGGELSWYSAMSDLISRATEQSFSSFEATDFVSQTTTEAAAAAEYDADADAEPNPDAYYESQKNILYRIIVDGETKYASEDWQSGVLTGVATAPEGFNFVLHFKDGKVQIRKDGENLNVYGDGVYDENSLWAVPGYENFPAGADVENVEVLFAVRQTPVRFMQINYQSRSFTSSDTIYWLYQDYQQARADYRAMLIAFAAGLVLLGVAILLRKARPEAEKALARLSPYLVTEARALLVGLSLGWMVLVLVLVVIQNAYDIVSCIAQSNARAVVLLLRCLCAALGRPWALLIAVWSLRLIRIDHHYNPADRRKSLLRLLSGAVRQKELKYPLQKRLYRCTLWRMLLTVALALAAVVGTLVIYFVEYDLTVWHLILWAALLVLGLGFGLVWLRRDRALARDFGALADQVETVRTGGLDTPLAVPSDSDLRQTAAQLNDIQAGLRAAVKEQTKSERMKVELVSNVSHDLKTPLTSILSYSELLMQEPLDGAAKDYATIIAQKAQRLKTMVQDVFEISKAASDQLPLELEALELDKLLRQTLADMQDEIDKSGLAFRVELPQQPVTITADGKRLYRVFQNLIQNALRYSLPGSRVYLTLKTDACSAEATLRNTSQTELPENVDFTARFVRGDESRSDGGSGLGLSIAKSFTEACGGSFRIETLADLFTAIVRFPLRRG